MGYEIQIDVDYPHHPKTLQLKDIIGPEADIYPPRLWCEATKYAPTGKLSGAQEVEKWCQWTGKSGKLYNALCKVRFIDRSSKMIHNWAIRSGYYILKYEDKKKKQRENYARDKENLPEESGRIPEAEGSIHTEHNITEKRRRGHTPPPSARAEEKPLDNDAYIQRLLDVYRFCGSPGDKTKAREFRDLIRQGVRSDAIESCPDRMGRGWDFFDYVKALRKEKHKPAKEEPVKPKCPHEIQNLKILRDSDKESLVECTACGRRDWVPKEGPISAELAQNPSSIRVIPGR